jgi:hypothetical protein
VGLGDLEHMSDLMSVSRRLVAVFAADVRKASGKVRISGQLIAAFGGIADLKGVPDTPGLPRRISENKIRSRSEISQVRPQPCIG